ncbi:hypothetical protein HBI67_001970 [Parastagonospora nodorum]|nr:hypothetical protein HBI67_001970 [Parastagonospora nodorum]KAH6090355.1 hypothetical protein HBI66_017640 [Parastagonospora nodorum]
MVGAISRWVPVQRRRLHRGEDPRTTALWPSQTRSRASTQLRRDASRLARSAAPSSTRATPRASHRWARSFFGAFFGDLALRTSTSPAQSQNLTIHILRLCSRKRLESRAACHHSPTRLLARLCAKTCPHSSALQPRREMGCAPSSSFQFLPVPSLGAGAYGMSPDREASPSARSPACISLPIHSIAVLRTKSRASLSAHLSKVSKITDTRHRTSSSVPGRHLSRNSTQTDIIGKFHKPATRCTCNMRFQGSS